MEAIERSALPYSPSDDRVLTLLLRLVGRSNPVHFLSLCPATGDAGPLRREIFDRLFPENGSDIFADGDAFRRACEASGVARVYLNPRVTVTRPVHVFPVHEMTLDAGFIIPLSVVAAPQWEVSDAFGTFGYLEQGATPLRCLMDLLRLAESVWQRRSGASLPARWLRPQILTLLCPIHMAMLSSGGSAQVPLLVAVLRSIGADVDGLLPFGNVPVFATGTLKADDGTFGAVGGVDKKLRAFVRELGSGHPALLTQLQCDEIRDADPRLLDQVQVIQLKGLEDLLEVPAICDGLRMLARRYHPSMNDRLLATAASLGKSINFVDAAMIDAWVLDRVRGSEYRSEYYAYQASIRLALNSFHQGRFADASRHMETVFSCLSSHPELFGVDDVGHIIGVACNLAIDACTPETYTTFADSVPSNDIARMTAQRRVEVLGSRCQFHRFFGDISVAVAAGRQAVTIADSVWASTAGQSRNYLVHALIVAAKEAAESEKGALLDEARHHLMASSEIWAPQDDARSRASHFGFCLHLEAEIARIAGQQRIPDSARWTGLWGHPWLFTLLSCARNEANTDETRRRCLDALVVESRAWKDRLGPHSLFGLFHAVYSLVDAVFSGRDQAPPAEDVHRWLSERAAEGFPGWQHQLRPHVSTEMTRADVDGLCDAIRYH